MHATDIVAYTYDADIHCVECTEKAYPGSTDWRREGFDPDDYSDGEGNPISPVFADGTEADTPQHCGTCRVFLENELTADGQMYLMEALTDLSGDATVLKEWLEFYSAGFSDDDWADLAKDWVTYLMDC